MTDTLPENLLYRAEYAKTGRANCKGCKSSIGKDELKLAFMVQSRFHDGKDAWGFHVDCFFTKHHPKTVGDIAHFEQLRWEDQELIKKKVAGGTGSGATASKIKSIQKEELKNYTIAYAKSAASTCQACEEKIPKLDVRISQKDYESEKAMMFSQGAGLDRWHHLDCFVKIREELGFFQSGNSIPGFKDLDEEDQKMVKKKLPVIKTKAVKSSSNGSSTSKRKLDEKTVSSVAGSSKRAKKNEDSEQNNEAKKQNMQMFQYRDELKNWKTSELRYILSANNQQLPNEVSHTLLDRITDIMTFGALAPCPRCKTGQLVFRSGVGYQCLGDLSEYTKCMYITSDPDRVKFKVPNDFREREPFISYKFKPQKRIFEKFTPSATVTSETASSTAGLKPKLTRKPLKDFGFLISCSNKEKTEKWANKVVEFGGKVLKKNSTKAAALITTEDEMANKSNKAVAYAKENGIPIVKGAFADALTELNYSLSAELNKNLICDWISDVTPWLRAKNGDYEEKKRESKKGNEFEKKLNLVKLKMKDGAVVDPDSGLEAVGHVLRDGKKRFFNCVLNKTSIEQGKNSYYKMQIIESDKGSRYWVFQAWGRIGTIIGGSKIHADVSKEEAIEIFEMKFYECTGNNWGQPFQKRPEMYTQLELDYGAKEQINKLVPSAKESTLPMSVQELICMIFDVDRMKQAMLEFELNLEEMPLGKISKPQVLKAYTALSEVSNQFRKAESGDEDAKRVILDMTNQFYTLIPHNFGSRLPTLLDNEALVKTKLEMLDSLLEIELAYELLLEGDKGGETSLDSHYKTLDAAIDPLESGSEEYAMLQKYLKNTHADTHSYYTLDVDSIFKVNRKIEQRRFQPFKEMHNRKLLWHGSRITNFAGILKQGLRIAPPEAPVTGYMFGKGVYFADMVSKSANYCYASRDNTSGLLLVCEVALGDMRELKTAKDTLTKAPKGCHSVKGLGQTEPNPQETITLPDGVQVPLGAPTKSKAQNSDLLYNEYIVYDVGQVNIRYLMKVNFNFTGRYGP